MGDAKRRGTFEKRKIFAMTRQKVDSELVTARKMEIESNKTPEQKSRENWARIRYMTFLEMAAVSMAFHVPYLDRDLIHNAKPKWRK